MDIASLSVACIMGYCILAGVPFALVYGLILANKAREARNE